MTLFKAFPLDGQNVKKAEQQKLQSDIFTKSIEKREIFKDKR